jgi:hypothetical protein
MPSFDRLPILISRRCKTKKEIDAAKKVQKETKRQKNEAFEEVYFKFRGKIISSYEKLFLELFDKNFSKELMYYTGKRIKYGAVKAIHITEKKLVETNCKEKGKEEKIGRGLGKDWGKDLNYLQQN